MDTSKTRYIDTADCAKMLRKQLKKSFPGAKFSVKISRYSGGSSMRVAWVDGPTVKQVRAVSDPYAGASFDGMIDMQHYNKAILLKDGTVTYGESQGTLGSRGVDPGYKFELPEGAEWVRMGSDYVHTDREYSNEFAKSAVDQFNKEELRADEPVIRTEMTKWGLRILCDDQSYNGPFNRFYQFMGDREG